VSAKAPAKGHTAKHTATSKAKKKTAKHHPVKHRKPATAAAKGTHVHAAAKPAKPAKARGFAVGGLLPVCAFEALAMSLRLAGQFVGDDEVAWLWSLAGADPLGASLAAALDTADGHGLAGFRPCALGLEVRAQDHLPLPVGQREAAAVGPVENFLPGHFHGLILGIPPLAPAAHGADQPIGGGLPGRSGQRADGDYRQYPWPADGDVDVQHALILGIDVPGAHCVLATADGWWSWGELHDPWPARIEEAWAVSWS
jgi:hypothetical protein